MKIKRKIPSLNINLEPGASVEMLTSIPQFNKAVLSEVLPSIKHGIESKKDVATLFELNNSNVFLDIPKTHWKKSLQNVLKFYEDQEDYNKCIECRDLISKL
jgi:prophage antirepressor-like protein